MSAELHDLPEGSESGDSEEATEVEVSCLIDFFDLHKKLFFPTRWPKKRQSLK